MTVRIHRDGQTKPENGRDGQHPAKTVDCQAFIEGLNHDLAGEYQAIVMYIHTRLN
jgi:hypothetical protein